MPELDLTPPIDSRPIPSVPGYRVCDGGEVFSCYLPQGRGRTGPWHTMTCREDEDGYLRVTLRVDSKPKGFLVHRLVLEAFVGPCPEGMEARHFPDRDRTNNRVKNLSWATHDQNIDDMDKHGTKNAPIGEQQASAKLSEFKVKEIFRLNNEGFTQCQIAKEFGVSQVAISAVLTRKTWSHVIVDFVSESRCYIPDGASDSRCKLKQADIVEIFRLLKEGDSRSRIAEIYGLDKGTVGRILRRRIWSHVPIPAEYLPLARAT